MPSYFDKKVKTIGEYEVLSKWNMKSIMIKKIINRLKRAAVYFAPESTNYFNNLKVYVVNSTQVNAFAAPGGIVVVNEGLVDKYLDDERKLKCNANDVNAY